MVVPYFSKPRRERASRSALTAATIPVVVALIGAIAACFKGVRDAVRNAFKGPGSPPPAVILLVLLLGACTTTGGLQEDIKATAPAVSDKAADELFVNATTPAQRKLRAGFAHAVALRVELDRVLNEDLTRAPNLYLAIERARTTVRKLRNSEETVWVELGLFEARQPLYAGAIDKAKEMAPGIIASIISRVGILDLARNGARRIGLASAMVADVRGAFDMLSTKSLTEEQAWSKSIARLCQMLSIAATLPGCRNTSPADPPASSAACTLLKIPRATWFFIPLLQITQMASPAKSSAVLGAPTVCAHSISSA